MHFWAPNAVWASCFERLKLEHVSMPPSIFFKSVYLVMCSLRWAHKITFKNGRNWFSWYIINFILKNVWLNRLFRDLQFASRSLELTQKMVWNQKICLLFDEAKKKLLLTPRRYFRKWSPWRCVSHDDRLRWLFKTGESYFRNHFWVGQRKSVGNFEST